MQRLSGARLLSCQSAGHSLSARAWRIALSKARDFFVGEIGTGKLSLLEAITVSCGFNPEGGSKDFSFATKDSHSELYRYLTTIKRSYPKDGFF